MPSPSQIQGNCAVHTIREAYTRFPNITLLWSIGKDSTTLLWMCRKAFIGKIPFPVIHIDTGQKFQEIYDFRDRLAEEWGLDLHVYKNDDAIGNGVSPDSCDTVECCNLLKTQALKNAIKDLGLDAVMLGIRRDEHGVRAKERVFSPRNQDFQWDYQKQPIEMWNQFQQKAPGEDHIRVHPMLHMTELDVWELIRQENIPVLDLYFAKNGKRYRSVGCEPCCEPVDSNASTVDEIIEEIKSTTISERAGRAQNKEDASTMQQLRALGYM